MNRALFAMLVLPVVVLSPANAQTGGVSVSPVLVSLEPGRNISSIRLRNGRNRPISFELEVYSWSQQDGQNVMTPTTELLITPKVFEVPENDEQIIRLGVSAIDSGAERAYRILIRELPSTLNRGANVGLRLEMSLPVFVVPRGAEPQLDLNIQDAPEGPSLVLTNTGNAHIQLASIDADDVAMNGPRYLLAGASVRMRVPDDAESVRVRAMESGRPALEQMIHVGQTNRILSLR
ncbi:MAG: fimbria/pilus periplasmic chaperone [Caulobacterales bacterium]